MTATIAIAAAEPLAEEPGWRDFARRFVRHRSALIGGTIVAALVLVALLSPWIAPYDYSRTNLLHTWEEPGSAYLLGADQLGRDILSRLIVGARVSLTVAFSVLAITLIVGTAAGMAAAWFGGRVESVIMRSADVTLAFPELILAILVAATLGPGLPSIVLSLAIVYWPGLARIVRSMVLSIRRELFIDAAIAAGTPTHRILLRHCLPNVLPVLVVRASAGVGSVIMAEAGLSFLGLGVQEPLPSWGSMVRDGLTALRTDPHMALVASAALGITIVGFNLLGDGLRDLLDPKLKDR